MTETIRRGSRGQTHNFLFSNSTPTPASWSQAPLIETGSLYLGRNEGVVRSKSSSSHPPAGLWKEKGQSRGLVSLSATLSKTALAFIKRKQRTGWEFCTRWHFLTEIRECVGSHWVASCCWHLWPWASEKLLWASVSSPIKWDNSAQTYCPGGTRKIKASNKWESTLKKVLSITQCQNYYYEHSFEPAVVITCKISYSDDYPKTKMK